MSAATNVYLRCKKLSKAAYILIIYLVLSTAATFAQSKKLTVVRRISTKDGLAGNIVKFIYQDKQGLIWLNTTEGLQRFDGNNFLSIRYDGSGSGKGLPSGIMNFGITEDNEGNIWATTEHEGPVKYNKKNGNITSYNQLIQQHEFLRSHAVAPLRDSSLLVSSVRGSYIIKNNNIRFTNNTAFEKNRDLANQKNLQQDKRGNTWIATGQGIVLLDATGQWHHHLSNKKSFKVLQHTFNVSSLLLDKDEQLWYSNWEWNTENKRFLYRYSWRKNIVDSIRLPNNPNNPSDEFYSIVAAAEEDKEGNIWLLTNGGHILIYNSSLQLIDDIYFFEYNNQLIQPSRLTAIHCDNEGYIWIAYEDGILITKRNDANRQKQYILPSEISIQPEATTVIASNLPIVCNQQNGLMKWDEVKKKFTGLPVPFLEGKWKNYLNYLTSYNDIVYLNPWFSDEVFKYDIKENKFSPFIPKGKLQHLLIQAVYDNEQIIFSGKTSLYFYSHTATLLDSIPLVKNPSLVSSMDINQQNSLLVIDTSALLTAIDLAKRKVTFTIRLAGLKGRRYRIKQIGDYYLIGTMYQGIQVYNKDGKFIKNISAADGLLSNNVQAIFSGANGITWIETTNGFNYIKDINQFAVFTVPELDMAYNGFKQAVYDGNHGFYFLYPGRLIYLPYLSLEAAGRKPFIFTSIKSSDGNLAIHQKETSLAWQNNTISFEFAAVDYVHASSMQYRYRLNRDKTNEWIISGSNNKAIFSKLKPGLYIFEAQYRHSNGSWQGSTLQYKFYIKQPFWKQWWFIISILLLIATISYIYYRKDYLSKKKISNLRWQLARDLHDEVGSTLSSINVYSSVLENRTKNEKDKFIIKEIKEKATDSIQNMSDIIWAIQPGNDSLQELIHRFRSFANPLAETAEIQLKIIYATDQQLALGLLQRRNIYLFLKELFNNGQRHASSKNIQIHFSYQGQLLTIVYKDDGKGFDPEKLVRKNGLVNMQQRIEELKGKLKIETSEGRGCCIEATIPL